MAAVRHVLKISDLTRAEIDAIIEFGLEMKADKSIGADLLRGKTVLAMFEKPSLRTRISQEIATAQMGGHTIYYDTGSSPLGTGKESPSDTAKVISSMVDVFTARVKTRKQLLDFSAHSTIPVVNALDDFAHPMQMLADIMTIREFKPEAITAGKSFKFLYCGDLVNNVTYDLMRLAAIFGWECRLAGPEGPIEEVIEEVEALCAETGGSWKHYTDIQEAAAGVDCIYTDSWMSYGVCKDLHDQRVAMFTPFKVTTAVIDAASPEVIFMNCLPADRTAEQTAAVIDGKHSVVFTQAENRLHSVKSLFAFLAKVGPFAA